MNSMTYWLGIKLKSGLVGISDTRITSRHETTQAKKVVRVNKDKHAKQWNSSLSKSIKAFPDSWMDKLHTND